MADAKITFETRFDSSQFDNSIGNIDKSLNNVRSTVMKVSSASLDAFGKSTRNEIERTTIRLAKKSQEIQNAIDKLNKMNKQYEDLVNKRAEPKILISMSRELDNINKKIIREQNAIKRFTDEGVKLKAELAQIESYRSGGRNLEATQSSYDDALKSVTQNNEMLKRSEDLLERLKIRAAELKSQMSEAKLNPENTDEAIRLKQNLIQTEQALQILNYEASSLEGNLNRAFEQGGASRTNKIFKSMSNLVGRISRRLKTSTREMKRFGKESRKSFTTIGRITNRIKRIAAATIFYQIFRAIFRAVRQYLELLVKSDTQLTNSLETLKFNLQTAFQPLWQAVLPTLQKIIDMLVVASAYLAKFTNMFFGKSLAGSKQAVKDLKAQEEGYNEVGKAAKKASKQVQGFDQLNKMQDNSNDGAGGGGGVSEITPVIKDIDVDETPLMRKMKEVIDRFTDVFKKAWDNEGKNTIDSMKSSLRSVIGLIESMGSSFMDVWTNGSGQRYLETILRIIQGINKATENLANNLKKAWETNEIGTKIIQGIFDMSNNGLEYTEKLINKIADWVLQVDFYPLLESLDVYIKSVGNFVDSAGKSILWLWDNVLAPFGSWVLEKLLPALIEFKAALFELGSALLDTLGPIFETIFDEFLGPLASIIGDSIINIITSLTETLNKFSDWARENEGAVKAIVTTIGTLLTLFAVGTIGSKVMGVVSAFKSFGGVGKIAASVIGGLTKFLGPLTSAISFLATPLGLIIGTIATLILTNEDFRNRFIETFSSIADTLKNFWDTIIGPIFESIKEVIVDLWQNAIKPLWDAWSGFVAELVYIIMDLWEVLKPIVDWIVDIVGPVIAEFFKSIVKSFGWVVSKVANGIEIVLKVLTDVIGGLRRVLSGIIDFIAGVFTGDWSRAWEGIKDIFGGVFDGIVAILKEIVNDIIRLINFLIAKIFDGVNFMSRALNNFKFDVPEWVPVIGGTKFGINIPEIKAPQIPMLAKGGLIPPRKPRQVIVGDNMVEDEIVSPVSTMKSTVKEAINEMGGLSSNAQIISILMQILRAIEDGHIIELDNREFGRSVVKAAQGVRGQTGKPIY